MNRHLTATVTELIALVASCVAGSGCYASVEPPAVDYAVTTGAPVDIETYPYVMYGGEPVYFYGDRWWHRDGGRWVSYHDEPAELRRQREVVIHSPRMRRAPHPAVVHEERR
jgi:hypothetical protein